MAESSIVDESDTEHEGLDERVGEYVRVAVILALLAVDLLIIYDQIKDRPDVVAWRARMAGAVAGPLRRARELRRAEKHVVWEAISVVDRTTPSTEQEPKP